MTATDVLMAEHRLIERVLVALENAADRMDGGEALPATLFADAADFIAGFADGRHHRKEEGLLFPALVAAGLPGDSGPVAVMLDDHELGRRHTRALRAAALRFASGDATARPEVVASARAYTALLRQHIAKEDQVLFPMAEGLLPEAVQARLADDFVTADRDEVGTGSQAYFSALADAVCARAGH